MKLMHATALSGAGVLALSLASATPIASAEQTVDRNFSHKSVKFLVKGELDDSARQPDVIIALEFPKSEIRNNATTAQSVTVEKIDKNGRKAKRWVSARYLCNGPDGKPGQPDCSIEIPTLKLKKVRSNHLVGLWHVQFTWTDESQPATTTQGHNYRFRVVMDDYDDDTRYLSIKKWKQRSR